MISVIGTAVLRSGQPLQEVGRWYVIRAQRQNRQGILQVDGVIVAEGQSPAGSRRANLERSIYIGGVKFWDNILDQVGVSLGMDGCIDEVRHVNCGVDFTTDSQYCRLQLFRKGYIVKYPIQTNMGATVFNFIKP